MIQTSLSALNRSSSIDFFFFLGNRWFTLEKQHGSNPSGSCHYGSAAGPDQIKLAQMRV